MLTIRKSEERHHIGNEDQKTWMTFDEENKADPLREGFGPLKILNEAVLSPGSGFFLRSNKDMIIITYVREGMIVYKGPLEPVDLMESKDFHRSNAPSDTKQYTLNVSQSVKANVFQCGFTPDGCEEPNPNPLPKSKGMKKLFTHAERQGVLKLIASGDGKDSSLSIQQDIQMYSTYLHTGNHIIHELKPGRTAWLHLVKGEILVNQLPLQTGDGIGLSGEKSVSFTAQMPSEILLFDLCEPVPGVTKTDGQPLSAVTHPSCSQN